MNKEELLKRLGTLNVTYNEKTLKPNPEELAVMTELCALVTSLQQEVQELKEKEARGPIPLVSLGARNDTV